MGRRFFYKMTHSLIIKNFDLKKVDFLRSCF